MESIFLHDPTHFCIKRMANECTFIDTFIFHELQSLAIAQRGIFFLSIWQEFFTRSAFMDLFIFNFTQKLLLIIF